MILDLFFSTKHEWKFRDGMGQSGEGDNMVRKVNCKLLGLEDRDRVLGRAE